MRILVDVSPLSLPRTGIGNYVRGMVGGLAEVAGERHEIVAFAPTGFRGRRNVEASLDGIGVERAVWAVPAARVWRRLWSRVGHPDAERLLGRFDVLHFSDWMYPPQRGGLRVTTIHDLVPLRFPDAVHPTTRRLHTTKYRHAARTCDVIFVNSEFTAGEVAELLRFPRERIRVAYPGLDPRFSAEGARSDLGGPYVLAVATRERRKNLDGLLQAFRILRRREPELRLAVVGVDGSSAEGVSMLGYVSDEELARLYRGASAFVYPSRFEGFGMPIVEAMGSGVPVVASNHPSLDEASGGAALRASPDHPESLADALEHALENPAPLVERGRRHGARFTWRACGEALLAGYESR
jgi:glycosyltransferase involved in cell wall biosynthesis